MEKGAMAGSPEKDPLQNQAKTARHASDTRAVRWSQGDNMGFTSITVSVFAIVGTLFFLFGRDATRRILGYLLAGLAALAGGCAWAVFTFQSGGWGHSFMQAEIQAIGTTNAWLVAGGATLACLWSAILMARQKKFMEFVGAVAVAACALTSATLEISSAPVVSRSNLPAGFVIDQPSPIAGNPSWATNKTPCTTDGPKVLRENAEAAGVCHN
jgi:hypothetical protein